MSEEKVLAIINHYDEMNVSKQETLDFFLENEDGTRRADFIKAAYGHRAILSLKLRKWAAMMSLYSYLYSEILTMSLCSLLKAPNLIILLQVYLLRI